MSSSFPENWQSNSTATFLFTQSQRNPFPVEIHLQAIPKDLFYNSFKQPSEQL